MPDTDGDAQAKKRQRVGCYIDGFNLYFGLRESELHRFLWLDLSRLAKRLIRKDQDLAFTKYFTARISGGRPTDNPEFREERNEKRKRQSNYLEAVNSTGGVQIIEGHYRDEQVRCNGCGRTWSSPEEKMTDVNIATQLIFDAFANRFDVAIVISADSDLVPPIREIRALLKAKRIDVAFPPGRYSNELLNVAHGQRIIDDAVLKKSQLAEEVTLPSGYKVKRPSKWT